MYGFDGVPLAFFDGESLYSFGGRHLGWLDQGWVRDHRGACVFFTEHTAGGGPMRPMRVMRPVKSVKSMRPIKAMKQMRPARASASLSWSAVSGREFFA